MRGFGDLGFVICYLPFRIKNLKYMHSDIISEREQRVLEYLTEHGIPFSSYNHPEGKTIEEA